MESVAIVLTASIILWLLMALEHTDKKKEFKVIIPTTPRKRKYPQENLHDMRDEYHQ